jgi:hypothetical protein
MLFPLLAVILNSLRAANRHLEMQQLPIGRPDPAPKRLIIQRKSHGKADARGLTSPEIAERQAIARKKAEKEAGEQGLIGSLGHSQ